MNTPANLKSPRKRPRPQSIIRNPYAKHNRACTANQNKQETPKPSKVYIGANERDEHYNLSKEEEECLGLGEELELASEFGGITEGLRDLTIRETGDELQEAAIKLAGEGKNIFLTGKAGTGKSWTIRRIVEASGSGRNKKIQLTAPTGIAAINIGGRTIHSWGGFKLGQHYCDFDLMMGEKTREMIRKTDTLLIDEISMVDGHLFDVLECMVAIIRCYETAKDRLKHFRELNNKIYGKKDCTMSPHLLSTRWTKGEHGLGDLEPWGGLQLIVVGDFFQLPPVPNNSSSSSSRNNDGDSEILFEDDNSQQQQQRSDDENEYHLEIGRQGSYAFESLAWQRSELQTVELQEVHRQSAENDDALVELLNAMREGSIDPIQHHDTLTSLQNPLTLTSNGIVPTELHALNRDVDRINTCNLDSLTGQPLEFDSLDEVVLDIEYKHKLLKKHKLLEYSDMPYLFASVEVPPTPPALKRASEELDALNEKKEKLKALDDFETLIAMRPKLTEWKDKVNILEREEKEKAVVSLSSVNKYLDQRHGSSNIRSDPNTVFQRFQKFDKRLQHDFGALEEHACLRFFQKSCRVNNKLRLKENSQVMLLWNLDVNNKLANGSRGVVTEFVPLTSYRRMLQQEAERGRGKEEKEGKPGIEMESGKACKCTTMGIPCICESTCESGNGESKAKGEERKINVERDNYHSMDPKSRVHECSSYTKEPEQEDCADPSLDPKTSEELKAHAAWLASQPFETHLKEEQKALDKAFEAGMTNLPYVRFTNGNKRLILPKPFRKEFKGCGFASRWQIPLCLAWAISIHKSQGMTIDWLHVNLKGCFENGQAYVACSRGRSLESMEVQNFNIHEIKTSKSVKEFYKSLSGSCKPYTATWVDSLEAFDALRKRKKELVRKYKDKRCDWCGALCNVQQVRKKNCNEGRFFVACSNRNIGERNHHFEWIPTHHPPTQKNDIVRNVF